MGTESEFKLEIEIGGKYAAPVVQEQEVIINGYRLNVGDIDTVIKRLGGLQSPHFINNLIESLGYSLDDARINILTVEDVKTIVDTCISCLTYIDDLIYNKKLSYDDVIDNIKQEHSCFVPENYYINNSEELLSIFVNELRDTISMLNNGFRVMKSINIPCDISYTVYY